MIQVSIKDVKPNPKNPRVIRDVKFKKLVQSIKEFPDMLNKRPLIVFTDVDGKYCVLGGNMRLKALNELKYTEIPVILADEWTEEQKAEFLIKDNVGFGEWDWDSLANEWDAEKLNDWGLETPYYSTDEINLDDFFNENNEPSDKESKFTIVLNYSEEDYAEITELFGKKTGSKEEIVLNLLKK